MASEWNHQKGSRTSFLLMKSNVSGYPIVASTFGVISKKPSFTQDHGNLPQWVHAVVSTY